MWYFKDINENGSFKNHNNKITNQAKEKKNLFKFIYCFNIKLMKF